MYRRAKLTQDDVDAAASAMVEAGEQVTVKALLRKVGGSAGTVTKMLKIWRDAHATPLPALVTLPIVVQRAITTFVADEATARQAALQSLLDEQGQLVDELASDNERLAQHVADLEDQIASQAAALARADGQLLQIRSAFDEAQRSGAAATQRADLAAIDLARTATKLEEISTLRKQINDLSALLADEREARIDAERAAAVAAERISVQSVHLADLQHRLTDEHARYAALDGHLRSTEYRAAKWQHVAGRATLRCKLLADQVDRSPSPPQAGPR